AMLKKIREENKLPIKDDDHVLVTIGGMHGLYMTFASLLSPNDEVILPDPVWSEIPEIIKRAGATPVSVVLNPERDFLYDPAEIEAAITSHTKAIYINSPHNPSGAVLSESTLKQIADIAIKHNLTVVSDEAYEHLIFDGLKHISIGSMPGMADRTISIFTMSKTYAMTGLRLGYMASNDEAIIERSRKLLRLTTNGVPSITQWGGVAALTGPKEPTHQMVAELDIRRNLFMEGIQKVKALHSFRPQGAFYVWSKIDESWPGYQGKRDSWAMTNYLIDQVGVGSSPGIAFGASGEHYVRFAFTLDRQSLQEACTAMQELFK
ncbi:MAG TPA: pyridoxal phosphate-dependent aminotransferase, partial [Longilinea sp.]|nr:pyridoxal phosphate-dependent aminotransferase [Longilinea sp.]